MPVLKPGSFKLGELSLHSEITGSKILLDSFATVVEFVIYEGMFTNSLSGNLLLTDSNNLVANIPIVGNEKLNMIFYKLNPIFFKASRTGAAKVIASSFHSLITV